MKVCILGHPQTLGVDEARQSLAMYTHDDIRRGEPKLQLSKLRNNILNIFYSPCRSPLQGPSVGLDALT